jgi:hypothetical protein
VLIVKIGNTCLISNVLCSSGIDKSAILPHIAKMKKDRSIRLLFAVFATLLAGSLGAQSLTFSEINYKSALTLDGGDWIELHNFGSTSADISGYFLTDTGATSTPMVFAAGTSIPAGGYLVVCRNAGNFASLYTGVPFYLGGNFSFKLNGTDEIKLLNASGALIINAQYDSKGSLGWPNGADGEGRTLQLRNEASNTGLSLPTSWRDGCMKGSPSTAPQADCLDPIIFSEVNYNSDSLKDVGEFVELYNRTNAPINIGGYYVRDQFDTVLNTYTFPAGTVLPPNGYVVVSNDSANFKKYFVIQANKFFANFDFNLNNGGEVLRLFKPNNVLQYSMHYNDSIPWTDSADGKGYTLEMKDYAKNCNDGTNWRAGCIGGSPFGPMQAACTPLFPLSVLDNVAGQHIIITPNPTTDKVAIQTPFAGTRNTFKICNTLGAVLIQQDFFGSNTEVNLSALPSNVYMVTLTNGKQHITKQIVKQ